MEANLPVSIELARRTNETAPLYRLAVSCLRDGDPRAAAFACRAAFQIDQTAVPLRAMLRGEPDDPVIPGVTLDRCRALVAGGFASSTMLAELTVAAALAGDEALVRSLVDVSRFFRAQALGAGDGEGTPVPGTADVAAVIHAGKRFIERGPGRAAIRNAWRYDHVREDSDEPVIRGLLAAIRSAVNRYIADLPGDPDHAFLANKPGAYRLSGWGVVSGADGHHIAHVHHRAWITCVYYVSVPPAVSNARERRGWLRLGAPDEVAEPARAGWEERWIQPYPDLLVIMPGYFHHETRSTLADEERICVAVDVIPA